MDKRLTRREAGELLDRMRAAARPGPSGLYHPRGGLRWERWQQEYGQRAAIVEFPLGELMNPRIVGFAWAWALSGRVTTAPIRRGDRFNAQGLEGKARVRTDLTVALIVYGELPRCRCQVLVEPSLWEGRRHKDEHQGQAVQAKHAAPTAAQVDLFTLV